MSTSNVTQLSEASVRLCEALAVLNLLMERGDENADIVSAAITLIDNGKTIIDAEDMK